MKYSKVLQKLESLKDPESIVGMARFGINPKKTYGLTVATVRKIAKEIGKDHKLALKLWKTGTREGRMIACLIVDRDQVSEELVEQWVKDLDSWDVCDHACGNLFDRLPFSYKKVIEWGKRPEEFVKRAAFSLIAWLAVHDKKAPDKKFIKLLSIIKRESTDERNYVRKAVNWALRSIGKRNLNLNKIAIKTAKEIQKIDSKSARWIAADAIRELTSPAILNRLTI